jgi:hypothetical protein
VASAPTPSRRRDPALIFVRYGLPALMVLAGVVILIFDPNVTGLGGWGDLTAAALSVLLMNVLWRAGVSGEADREAEDAARRYFDEHGHWPD